MDLTLGQGIQSKAEYLRTLPAIRQRCGQVFSLAEQDRLEYFVYNPSAESEPVDFCAQIIQVRGFLPSLISRVDPVFSSVTLETIFNRCGPLHLRIHAPLMS